MKPGEYWLESDPIIANQGRRTRRLLVRNRGDRPVQVGSHYHFFEANRALAFARESAYGMRLNIPAGTAARFEPGEAKEVELTEFGGGKLLRGLNGLGGEINDPQARARAVADARKQGFRFEAESKA